MQSGTLNSENTSRRLVERIATGELSAETELFKEYARALRHIARRNLPEGSDADDIVQETFRIGIERLRSGDIKDPAALPGFLRGIALKLCNASGRERWREQPGTMDDEHLSDIARSDASPLENASADELRAMVRRLISEMAVPRDRLLLRGYYVEDIDKAVLCQRMGLSQDHFDRVLHRARARLRELAEKFDSVTQGAPQ